VSLASFTKHLEGLEWKEENNQATRAKKETQITLSQVTKHLIWFWSLERIWCFDCVFGVYSLLLYWMRRVRSLDNLNGGDWGVFIASNHFLSVGWLCCRWAHRTVRCCTGHYTVHCPVHATSADRWGLELSTVEVLCPLAAPDSPMAHRKVRCVLTLQTDSDFWRSDCSVVDHWQSWQLL
jgi:hypothetical protein